ncbi:MAG: CotH kinase family protein [Bryobacterales bacterium]|nr:CotH kinase family protein [Bryobacterales bacterium]
MIRFIPLLTLLLAAGSSLHADEAATFFDDSAVREIRLYFDNANWYSQLYQSHATNANDPYFPARFQSGNTSIAKIGARFKGNSSFQRNGVKKPFKLDFHEYDDTANFYGLKKLNLHNGDLQPDFLHEKMFLDFASKYIAAMRSVHVRLYVNDVYYGLYLAVEQPDKVMMQSRFGSEEDGNLYEAGENVQANMSYLGTAASAYTSRYELKTNETANDYSGLINMLEVLNNTATADLPARIEPVMDIENIMNGMALNALFTNLESYLGSAGEYFLYQRSRDKRFVHIHWDTNETFGSTGDGTTRLANPFIMDPFWLPTAGGGGPGGGGAANNARPLLEKLWAVDKYKRLYLQVLARFLRDGFDEQTFSVRSQALANLIRADFSADPNKAYTMAQFETALNNQVTANNFTTYGITQFVRERAAYLRNYLASQTQPADLRLNEIAAGGAQRDEAGDADPWVEIHNLGPGALSTSGYYLSDESTNPTKWAVPVRSLADGAFLTVWLDGETAEGDMHASFRLAASGGTLYLYASSSGMQTPLDSVKYGAIANNQSYARVGMFGSSWSATASPTFAATNSITTLGISTDPITGNGKLLVNEFMADNDAAYADPDEAGAFEDWFEVFNPGSSAVDMSGMYISDSLSNPTKWKVPDGVTVPARGYLVFIADGETTQGSRHTSWSLSADGESISIYETDGKTVIDSVAFGPQRTDVAMGRTTDAAAEWSLFSTSTPGAANSGALANWVMNAAGYQLAPIAPDSIAVAFAAGITSTLAQPTSTPLPTTLAGVTATLTDSAGASQAAPLYYVANGQLSFQVPATAAAGKARLSIRKQDGSTTAGDFLIAAVAPGLFSANATGTGIGLIAGVRVSASGTQTPVSAYTYDSAAQKQVAVPISLGAETDQVYLVVYGTGLRNGTSNVTASIGGTGVPITFAGAQPSFAGLDQINLGPLPRTLAGKGEVALYITAGGNRSNSVTVSIE